MKFIRYRKKWAYGYGEWKIVSVPDAFRVRSPEEMDTFFSLINAHDNDEKFRGLEWKTVKKPPKEYLESEISFCNRQIESDLKRVKELESLVTKHYG